MRPYITRAVARTLWSREALSISRVSRASRKPIPSSLVLTSVRLLSWDAQPSPPRLPPDQQAEFEQLVRKAQESAAAASLADAMKDAAALTNTRVKAMAAANMEDERNEAALNSEKTEGAATAAAAGASTSTAGLNGNPIEGVWRGAPPEFEGERNPRTGEVGGPKNEPLRWGTASDWSYNGRVTDF